MYIPSIRVNCVLCSRQRIVVVPSVLFGRSEPQGSREPSWQPGQRDHGLVQRQLGMGAEPVVREDRGAVGIRRISGGCAVRYDDHPRRVAEEKTVQTRLVFHRVLRQRRFLLQRVPVQNTGITYPQVTFNSYVRRFHLDKFITMAVHYITGCNLIYIL